MRFLRHPILACLVITLCTVLLQGTPAEAAKCLYVSSYHKGYEWSDKVEKGLRSVLEGQCELVQIDMDTKRNKSKDYIAAKALEIKDFIESWQPDVVITSDDNAAKYLVKPYFRDHEIPFVFCGVNWTVKEYEFPYRNVTGIVEVAPIEPMLEWAMEIEAGARQAFYLGANTLTERKNVERLNKAARRLGLSLEHSLVDTTGDWLAAYRAAQSYDVVILGSNAGINNWDSARVEQSVQKETRRLSVTNHGWMMPYTLLGVTKVPEEHGAWAAKAALRILDGVSPNRIPIVSNRRRDLWVNQEILAGTDMELPSRLVNNAKKVSDEDES